MAQFSAYDLTRLEFDDRACLLYQVAKKVPGQLLVCGIGGPLKVQNGTKLILDDQGNQFEIVQVLQKSPIP